MENSQIDLSFLEEAEPQQTQENIQDKIINQYKRKYITTRTKYCPSRVKSRNFLSNISYTGLNKSDLFNENFILDVFVLLKNLNPFSLNWKVVDKIKHEMVYMLWKECVPIEFYRCICDEKNFVYLDGQEITHGKVLEIVCNFFDESDENITLLQEQLARFKDVYQYVYSHVFPEVYTASEKRGFNLKSNFHILFKTYRDKMILQQQTFAKNAANFNHQEFEQKPIKLAINFLKWFFFSVI